MILYASAIIIQKGISFFLLPLYTSQLIPSEYGTLNIVTGVCSFYGVLATLGMDAAAGRYYIEYKDDNENRKKFIGTVVYFTILVSMLLAVLLLIFGRYLVVPFAEGVPYYPHIIIGIVYILTVPIYSMYQRILLMKENANRYSANLITNFLMQTTLSIIFVVVFKLQSLGVILAMCITGIIFFIISIRSLKVETETIINKTHLITALKYSIPLIPHTLSNWVNTVFDRIILARFYSLVEVGIYNVANQLGMITNVFSAAINQAYVPWLYGKIKDGQNIRINQSINILTGLFSLLGIGIILLTPEILNIMVDESYHEALELIPIFVLAYSYSNLYLAFLNIVMYHVRYAKYIGVVTFSGACLNMVSNLIFIPRYSMYGAALTSLGTKLIVYVVIMILARSSSKIRFDWFKIILFTATLTIIAAVSITIKISLGIRILMCIVTLAGFICVLNKDISALLNFSIFNKFD